MSSRHLLWAALVPLAVQGCICNNPVDDPGSTVPGQCQVVQPEPAPQKLDILFVVDNSSSMREEQEKVAAQLTAFIDEVKKSGGVAQDFHVGVITTSVYMHYELNGRRELVAYPNQAGKLQPVPELSADGGVRPGTGTERMLTGDDPELVEKFARLVQVGIWGSGHETPFEAVRLALTPPLIDGSVELPLSDPSAGNAGFFRDRARLLVVVVSDEDDCSELNRPPVVYVGLDNSRDYCTEQGNSLTPVSEYHRVFTEELKDGTGASREIVWATIGPVGLTSKQVQGIVEGGFVRNIDCPDSNEPGHRQKKMAELFDTSLANLDSICRASYRDTLVAIAGLANVSQTLELRGNVPDERLLNITLVRKDGSTDVCTLQNGGLTVYDPPSDGQDARVHFGNQCVRRADDTEVQIRLLCAG